MKYVQRESFMGYRRCLGNRLKDYRLSKGLSGYRVAKNGGLIFNQVTDIEKGEKNYTIDILLRYMKGCGLKIHFSEEDDLGRGSFCINSISENMSL